MSKILFEEENFSLSFIEDYLINIHIKDFREIKREDILKVQIWVSNNNKKENLYNLVEFGIGSSASRGAREYAASREGNKFSIGTAIIVRNLAQQLIMDYYIKFNNPIIPTRVFFKRDKALSWINEQRNKSFDNTN